jgi:hypothetical protein
LRDAASIIADYTPFNEVMRLLFVAYSSATEGVLLLKLGVNKVFCAANLRRYQKNFRFYQHSVPNGTRDGGRVFAGTGTP